MSLKLFVCVASLAALAFAPGSLAAAPCRSKDRDDEDDQHSKCLEDCYDKFADETGRLPLSQCQKGSDYEKCANKCDDEHVEQIDAYYPDPLPEDDVDYQLAKIKADEAALWDDEDDEETSGGTAPGAGASNVTRAMPVSPQSGGRKLLQNIGTFRSLRDALTLLRDADVDFSGSDFEAGVSAINMFQRVTRDVNNANGFRSASRDLVQVAGARTAGIEALVASVDLLDGSTNLFGRVGNIAIDNIQTVTRQLGVFIDSYLRKRFEQRISRDQKVDFNRFQNNMETTRKDILNLNRLSKPGADNNRITPVKDRGGG